MSQAVPVYDLVGVGFGPSNLALAIALTEHNARARHRTTGVFLERQPRFGWHRGMLIDDATMQVSFLKDLVTLRNPTSEFSFLSYLHGRGRLIDFINHKSLFPLRVEFHDYLEWAAAKVDDLVLYGQEVVGVEPVGGEFLDVTVRGEDGVSRYRASNLVLATGLRPHLPDGIAATDRVWHNRDLLDRVDGTPGLPGAGRFVVVGAGQSAAEVAAFLHERFPRAEVCPVFARYGYSPADDSPFANRIFDPAAVGEFFDAPPEVKRSLVDYHANTNYSVVDTDLIDELYRRVYREKVLGAPRLRVFNLSRVAELVETATGVRVTVRSLVDGAATVLDADAVVYATGYRPADPGPLLAACRVRRDEQGRLRVGRDYRVLGHPEADSEADPKAKPDAAPEADADAGSGPGPGIYLQGGTEHTHGITSSLLSNTAIRAAEILRSIVDSTVPAPQYI